MKHIEIDSVCAKWRNHTRDLLRLMLESSIFYKIFNESRHIYDSACSIWVQQDSFFKWSHDDDHSISINLQRFFFSLYRWVWCLWAIKILDVSGECFCSKEQACESFTLSLVYEWIIECVLYCECVLFFQRNASMKAQHFVSVVWNNALYPIKKS